MIEALFFIAGLAAVRGANVASLCTTNLQQLNCLTEYRVESDERVCGNDGVTYTNFCQYAQARCSHPNMHLDYIGSCTGTVVGSTNPPATTMPTVPTTTLDPALVTFCTASPRPTCSQELAPVCGSDMKLYLNKCEFSRAFCNNNSLSSKDLSFCTGS
ncbi:follistatin-like [Dreissena polymorpha]|uniref:Kazal-like domain-containing protein n=1 Tax=Dreissena polymorpha TaxID=45954 RepID=A0A9D3Y5P9_DREPO|nr:follistatin-like [Dreissena polymorpha]KAH3692440.1 hypothetical protein DPMN_194281 [Dreissena polymorpha]